MTKEILIKSAIKLLVNEQIKQVSWGYALEEDSAYEVSWKDVLKWLENEPCEDAISREETLKAMCDKCPMYNCVTRCSSYRHIEKMPSVTPQPKTGKWIDDGQYAEGHSEHAYRCSECGENYIGYVGKYKYCPNCGAKMKESGDKNEK